MEIFHNVHSSIICFWCGHNDEDYKVHWTNATCLYRSKDDGDLGFGNIGAFNGAILAKQVWRPIKDQDSLVARLIRARYYPHGNLFNAILGNHSSFTWHCLLGVPHVICVSVFGCGWTFVECVE